MNNIYANIVDAAYQNWQESESYQKESNLENSTYDKMKLSTISVIGENNYHEISDFVVGFGVDAEQAGFEVGFIQGIMFMIGVMHGKCEKIGGKV